MLEEEKKRLQIASGQNYDAASWFCYLPLAGWLDLNRFPLRASVVFGC